MNRAPWDRFDLRDFLKGLAFIPLAYVLMWLICAL